MSVRALSWVLDNSDAPGNDRLVLIAIADEADDDGTNAYPSIDRIARRARVNKRTTMRALERLEEAGELVIVRPTTSGRGHFNRYGVVMGRDPVEVRELVEHPGKGDTLAPTGNGAERRATARNGAPKGAPDPQTHGPTDPKAKTRARSLITEQFAEFWTAYPHKAGKPAAEKAWRAHVLDPEAVMVGLARWAVYWTAVRTERRFIPHPATWLNQERWNDEVPTPGRGAAPMGPRWVPTPEEEAAAREQPVRELTDSELWGNT